MIHSDLGKGYDWIVGPNLGCFCWTFERQSTGRSKKGAKEGVGNGKIKKKVREERHQRRRKISLN